MKSIIIINIAYIFRYNPFSLMILSYMQISSIAFKDGSAIPSVYTCDGKNINPPLNFSNVPENTKSLVLIVDDPDAPIGDWVHWLVFNMSPNTINIDENSKPESGIEGMTSFGKMGYGGPCPPNGTHRYFFKLYALDVIIGLNFSASKSEIINEMDGHILAQSQLIGTYER